jgi:hypothetical protein
LGRSGSFRIAFEYIQCAARLETKDASQVAVAVKPSSRDLVALEIRDGPRIERA